MTKFTKWKKWQKLSRIISKPHLQTMAKHVQSFIMIGIKLYEELRSQGTHCLYTFIELRSENDKVHKVEKVAKINSRIISKPHAHLQTMAKTCAKFHKDRYKIVWGVVLTRYPLSLHFHRIWGQKMTKFTKWKKLQKLIQGLYPNHMHISRPWGKHVQSFKKIGIKLYEELRSQGTHCHNTFIESENDKVRKVEKVTKINVMITSKPYAHLQTMEKTCAKFQKDRYKIVWGVALTRYPVYTLRRHEKWLKITSGKSDKK